MARDKSSIQRTLDFTPQNDRRHHPPTFHELQPLGQNVPDLGRLRRSERRQGQAMQPSHLLRDQ